ncbi:MAG: hypothetical protein GC137_06885 [Alphaproteobacteria bacterium]|nr:hypothetical protein [Alphaproteobacteria bacterium]
MIDFDAMLEKAQAETKPYTDKLLNSIVVTEHREDGEPRVISIPLENIMSIASSKVSDPENPETARLVLNNGPADKPYYSIALAEDIPQLERILSGHPSETMKNAWKSKLLEIYEKELKALEREIDGAAQVSESEPQPAKKRSRLALLLTTSWRMASQPETYAAISLRTQIETDKYALKRTAQDYYGQQTTQQAIQEQIDDLAGRFYELIQQRRAANNLPYIVESRGKVRNIRQTADTPALELTL